MVSSTGLLPFWKVCNIWNSLITNDIVSLFIFHLCINFNGRSVQIFCHLLLSVPFLKLKSSLYISFRSRSSYMSSTNIFSHFWSVFSFILLLVSFAVQKFLVFMNSCSSILSFMVCAFSAILKYLSFEPKLSRVSSLKFSSLIVLNFIFRATFQLEWTFLKDVRSLCSLCFVFAWGCEWFQHHLLERFLSFELLSPAS